MELWAQSLASRRNLPASTYQVQKKKIFFFNFKIYLIDLSVLPGHMSVHHMCAWSPSRSVEEVKSLGFELQMAVNHHFGSGN